MLVNIAQDSSMGSVSEHLVLGLHATSAETLVPPEPKRLTFGHFDAIHETIMKTLDSDPLSRYLMESEEQDRRDNVFLKAMKRLFRDIYRSQYVELNTAWTIDDGDAFVCYSDPAKPTPIAYRILASVVAHLEPLMKSKEQMKRIKEVQSKLRPALKEVVEAHGKDMFCVEHLACTPAKQGRGYGTTLCKLVTEEADSRSLKTWLVSSNVKANTTFYNNLGFFNVKTIILGDENPTWKESPVKVDIMVREVPATHVREKSLV